VFLGLAIAMFTSNRRIHGAFVILYFFAGAGYDLVVFSQTA